jgi:hypothetical protein
LSATQVSDGKPERNLNNLRALDFKILKLLSRRLSDTCRLTTNKMLTPLARAAFTRVLAYVIDQVVQPVDY